MLIGHVVHDNVKLLTTMQFAYYHDMMLHCPFRLVHNASKSCMDTKSCKMIVSGCKRSNRSTTTIAHSGHVLENVSNFDYNWNTRTHSILIENVHESIWSVVSINRYADVRFHAKPKLD